MSDDITAEEIEYWREKLKKAHRARDAYCQRAKDLREKLDTCREQRDEYWDELARMSGGFEARIENRRELQEQLDSACDELFHARHDRDEYRRKRDELRDELARVAKQRDDALEALSTERQTLKTDGDLLADIMENLCPPWMTTQAARDLAESAVAELARIGPGVVVLRGTHSEPWTPDSEPDAASTTFTDVVDATIWGDEWSEYGVFALREGKLVRLLDDCTETEARRVAAYIPHALVQRRSVHSTDWEAI